MHLKIEEKELLELREKARKWDKVMEVMDKAYEFDENTGEPIDNGQDLCTIGEKVCIICGYL